MWSNDHRDRVGSYASKIKPMHSEVRLPRHSSLVEKSKFESGELKNSQRIQPATPSDDDDAPNFGEG